MTAKEVCEVLAISNTTLHNAVVRGELGVARWTPGGHRRFDPAEVRRFDAELKQRFGGNGVPPAPSTPRAI